MVSIKENQACGNKVGDAKALKAEIMERTGDVYRVLGPAWEELRAYEEGPSLDECVPIQDQELQELHREKWPSLRFFGRIVKPQKSIWTSMRTSDKWSPALRNAC